MSLVQPKTMLNGVMAHRQSPRYFAIDPKTCTLFLLSILIAFPCPSRSGLHRAAKTDRVRTASGKSSYPACSRMSWQKLCCFTTSTSLLHQAPFSHKHGWTRRPIVTALLYPVSAAMPTDLAFIVVIFRDKVCSGTPTSLPP